MNLEFQYIPEDLQELQKLVLRGLFLGSRKRMFRNFLIILPFFLLIGFINKGGVGSNPAPVNEPQSLLKDILIPLLPWLVFVGLIVFVGFRFFGRIGMKALISTDKELSLPQSMHIGDDGIAISSSQRQANWKWQAFSELWEGKTILVLRLAKNSFLVIPKRAIPSENAPQLTEMLRERFPSLNKECKHVKESV